MLVAAYCYFASSPGADLGRVEQQAAIARIASGTAVPRSRPTTTIGNAQPNGGIEPAAAGTASPTALGTNATPASGITAAVTDMKSETLIKSIKSELARVGCYKGEIDAQWNEEARRAMQKFNARVLSKLPVEKPDYILLTLLRGQSVAGCELPCPENPDDATSRVCGATTIAALADPRPAGSIAVNQVIAPTAKNPPIKPAQALPRRPSNPPAARKVTAAARQPSSRTVVRAAESRPQQRAEPATRTARAASSVRSLHEQVFRHIAMNAP